MSLDSRFSTHSSLTRPITLRHLTVVVRNLRTNHALLVGYFLERSNIHARYDRAWCGRYGGAGNPASIPGSALAQLLPGGSLGLQHIEHVVRDTGAISRSGDGAAQCHRVTARSTRSHHRPDTDAHEVMPGCPTACGGEEWHPC